jgi:hypothetical protein
MGRPGTPPAAARRPGQHSRNTTRRLALRALAALVAIVALGVLIGAVAGFTSPVFITAELAAIAAMRLLRPVALTTTTGRVVGWRLVRVPLKADHGNLAAADFQRQRDATVDGDGRVRVESRSASLPGVGD